MSSELTKRKPLYSVTAKDCRFDFFRGSGKGGQNRNKRDTACRCVHEPSGAIGNAQDERQQHQNKVLAFKRMAETKEFKRWIKLQSAKVMGVVAQVEEKVEQLMKQPIKVEIKDENGLWKEVSDKDIVDEEEQHVETT